MNRIIERVRIRWRRYVAAALVVAIASSPLWARRTASRLAFFRVRHVDVRGVRYVAPGVIAARLRLDTLSSVWMDRAELERRVAGHPQVAAVRIRRHLPGSLIVDVTENLPVALVSTTGGFRVYDKAGRALPIDLTKLPVDAPIIAHPDTTLLRLLAEVRGKTPGLFSRINDMQRVGRDEVVLHLASLPVRAMADVSADRLAEIFPVEDDLVRRQAHVAELDLRFRDQVIARLQ